MRLLIAPILLLADVAVIAQPRSIPPLNAEPPTEVKAAAQSWLVHQDWYCRSSQTRADVFADLMRKRMSDLGARGWEIVGFAFSPIAGQECFTATFKAPRK